MKNLAFEMLLIVSAAGSAFLRPLEDLRRDGAGFAGGLALIAHPPVSVV